MRMWLRASSKSCRGGSRVNLYVLLLACMLKTICGETTLTSIFRNTFVPSEVSGRLSGQKCADAPGVSNTTSCECRDGWTGPSCSIPEKIEHYLLCDLESSSVCKEHTNAPCAGRGSVSSDGNCVCDWGFIGSSCQTRGLPLPRTSVKGISVAEGGSALGEYTIVLEEPPVFGTVSVHVYAEGYGDDEEQDDVAKEAGPQVMLVGMSGRGVTRLELEFDAGNWHVPQRVAVAAVDDEWVEGPHTVLIVHSVHTPLGLKGPGTAMVLVDVADNDAPGARILPANATVEEGGPPLHLKVVLDKPPYPGREVHVHLDVAYPDDRAQLELARTRVIMTSRNMEAEVDVLAPRCHIAEGVKSIPLDFSTHSTLPPYNELQVDPVAVTVADVDVAGLIVKLSHGDRIVVNGTEDAYFTVALSSKPSDVVILRLSKRDRDASAHGQVVFLPARLVFQPGSWDVPQLVQVKANEDGVVTGDANTIWDFAIVTNSAPYAALMPQVPMQIVDNDNFGVATSHRKLQICSLEGCAGTYSLYLTARPSRPVSVTIYVARPVSAKGAEGEGDELGLTVTPTHVTFNVDEWSLPQLVVVQVSALDACPQNSSLVYVVRHEVAADSAPEYASLARDKAPSVQVSVVPETEVDESRPRARQLQSLEMRTSAGFLAYTEDSGTVVVDPSIVLTGGVIEEAYVTVSPVSADETDFLTVNEGELISESGKILELLPVNAYTVRFVAGVQNSAAAFQKGLRAITYENPGPKVNSVSKTVTFTVVSAGGSSVTATRSLTITLFNHAPTSQSFALSTTENKNRFGQLRATDPEGKALLFMLVCQPGKGQLNLTNSTTGTVTFFPYLNENTGKDLTQSLDTFIWKALDDQEVDTGLQLGTIAIEPFNSKPIAPNVSITVTAGEEFAGNFTGTYDPDALDPTGDYCPDWCLRDFTFLSRPIDPLQTTLKVQSGGEVLSFGAGMTQLTGSEPFLYNVAPTAESAMRLYDEIPFVATDNFGWVSDVAYLKITINVIVVFTPPLANNMNITVQAGDSITMDLNGTNSAGGQAALGYYLSVGGFKQVFQNNTYTFGEVMMHPSELRPRFLYGPSFTYTAGTRVGVDQFEYFTEDRAFNMSRVAGIVTVNVMPRNEPPVPSCEGYPGSIFGDQSVQDLMVLGDIYNTDATLLWFEQNFPNENPDYSDAVSYFRNTTVPILCGGPMVDPATGLENLCLEPAAQLVCNSNVTHPARMSNPDLTLTDANNQQQLVAAYDQGGVHLALHVYDADGAQNLTLYQLNSLPTRGRLFFNASGPFTDPAAPGAVLVQANDTFLETPGVALQLTYVPDTLLRGFPLDSFTWSSFDGRSKSTGPLQVWLDTQCSPGYYRIDPAANVSNMEVAGRSLAVPGAREEQCFPCPEGMFNLPGVLDQTECFACQRGEFSLGAATQCTPCPLNTFQDEVARGECKPCPDAQWMVTLQPRSTLVSQCLCDVGTWAINPGLACEWCDPTVIICNELDQAIPKPIRIGDQIDAETGTVLVCRPAEACDKLEDTDDVLAGKCHEGYTGKACRACLDGYFRNAGDCDKCLDTTTTWLSVAAMFLFSTPFLIAFARGNALSGIKVYVNYVQTMAIIRYFPLGWSDELKAVFDMMSVFNLDWFILSPECLLGMDYPHRVWMVTLGCGISAVYMWAYYALNRTLSPQSLSPFFYKEVISAYLLFLNWNYINLCVTTLQYFSCVHLNGWYVLGLDPSIDCFDFKNRGLHAQLLPAGVVSLAVYPIGIFAMFSWVIISNRDVLRNHKLIRTTEELLNLEDEEEDEYEKLWRIDLLWGFAYKNLDSEFFYWELVRFGRKLLLAAITIVHNPVEQVALAVAVYIASFVATLYAHPNDSERIDVLETVQHISILVMLIGGYILRSGLLTTEETETISHGLVIMIYLSMCIIFWFIMSEIKIFDDDDEDEEEDAEAEEEEMTEQEQAKEIYEMENEGTYPARLSSGGHASFRESKTFSRSGSRNASFQISHKGELLRSASSFKTEDAMAKTAKKAKNILKSLTSKAKSMKQRIRGVPDDDDGIVGKDPRKERVVKTAKVVFSKPFVKKLIAFLNSSVCTVQDVKQLEAVTQALVTVHWEAHLGIKKDGDEEDKAASVADDRNSLASFVSGMSNTSMKIRRLTKLADSSLKSFGSLARGNTMSSETGSFKSEKGGLSSMRSHFMSARGSHARSRTAGSMTSFNTLLGHQRKKMQERGLWVPKCYDIIQTDKIISTFKWLAFEISDDAQALFWRWLDAAAWKLSEEIEEQAEAREQARQESIARQGSSTGGSTAFFSKRSLISRSYSKIHPLRSPSGSMRKKSQDGSMKSSSLGRKSSQDGSFRSPSKSAMRANQDRDRKGKGIMKAGSDSGDAGSDRWAGGVRRSMSGSHSGVISPVKMQSSIPEEPRTVATPASVHPMPPAQI